MVGALGWTWALAGTWFCDDTCPANLTPFQVADVLGACAGLVAAALAAVAIKTERASFLRASGYLLAMVYVGFALYIWAFNDARPY
jgi:high-affinity Fe2+/Pb2+ permease